MLQHLRQNTPNAVRSSRKKKSLASNATKFCMSMLIFIAASSKDGLVGVSVVDAYAINGKENMNANLNPSNLPLLSRRERQAEILNRARRKVAQRKVAQMKTKSGIHRDESEKTLMDANDFGDFESARNDMSTPMPTLTIPQRPLQPPFPDGICGSRLVTLSPEDLNWESTSASENDLAAIIENGLSSFSSSILPPRNITVWLPPDYDAHPEMKFPVLYCHDGQNAMIDSTSWTGYSWRLAGALTRLAERNMLTKTTEICSPPIVVMMPCAEDRIGAVVPRRHLEYGDISLPFAQAHADFVGLTLKPLIDSKFRTLPDKQHTSTIGSSLGGQASLHLIMRYQDLFGKAACLSPAFQPSILTSVAASDDRMWIDKQIYIDNGGDVDDVKVPILDVQDHLSKEHWWNPGYWWLDSQLQPGIDAMKLALDAKGIEYSYRRFAGGRHNERGWASRIDKPLLYLYGIHDEGGDASTNDVLI